MKKHTGFLLATAAVIAMALVVGTAYGASDSHDDHNDHGAPTISEELLDSLNKLHEQFMDAWAKHGDDMAKTCRS